MEGPSLFLAKEQLKPFKKKRVVRVSGNTTIEKDRFAGHIVKEIFSWGKHLLFQFDGFALKVHFLLFGTFSAVVEGKSVTGDYILHHSASGQRPISISSQKTDSSELPS